MEPELFLGLLFGVMLARSLLSLPRDAVFVGGRHGLVETSWVRDRCLLVVENFIRATATIGFAVRSERAIRDRVAGVRSVR